MSTVRVLLCMLGLCLQSCSCQAEEPPVVSEAMNTYYTRQSRISDVMHDSAFGDYGRLIFPVNTGYWNGTTLEQLQLTWYNYIDPDKTVEVCNYLRTHADNCFIDIYTEAEKQANTRQQDSVYSLNGIRRNTMQRGINIVGRRKIIH